MQNKSHKQGTIPAAFWPCDLRELDNNWNMLIICIDAGRLCSYCKYSIHFWFMVYFCSLSQCVHIEMYYFCVWFTDFNCLPVFFLSVRSTRFALLAHICQSLLIIKVHERSHAHSLPLIRSFALSFCPPCVSWTLRVPFNLFDLSLQFYLALSPTSWAFSSIFLWFCARSRNGLII